VEEVALAGNQNNSKRFIGRWLWKNARKSQASFMWTTNLLWSYKWRFHICV